MTNPKINMMMQAHGGFEIMPDGFKAGMPEVHIVPPDGVYVIRKVYTPANEYVGMEYLVAIPEERRAEWRYVDRDEDDSRFDEAEPIVGLGGPWNDYELPLDEWTDDGIKGLLERDKKGTLTEPYQHLVDEAKRRNWVPGMNGDRTEP